MTPTQFAALAAATHGIFGWQSKVARDHNVHRSTVQRWAAGELEIPPAAIVRLKADARAKLTTLWDLAR